MPDSPAESTTEIETLEQKHAANPEGRYFVPLANAYRKAGGVEHAEALLREGLQKHPDYLSAHIVLGRCLADRGATAEASEEFRYVLSLDPQNLIALRTLGELAVEAGHPDEAQRWYEELLAVDPMNEDARGALDALREGEPATTEEPGDEGEFQAGGGWWEAPEPAEERGEQEAAGPQTSEQELPPTAVSVEIAQEPEGELLELDDVQIHVEDGAGAGAVDGGGEDVEVVTETIAELYARQGFTDRAIGVYRELIRRRGGDAALEHRLAELERGPAPEPRPAEAPLLPESAATAPEEDVFAASFAHGFDTTAEEPATEEPAPEPAAAVAEEPAAQEAVAEEPVAEEPAAAAPSIARYLSDLLAWTPAGGPAPAASPEEAPATEEESAPGEAVEAPEPELPEPPAGTVGEPARSDEDLFPWELPPQSTQAEATSTEEDLFSFEAFLTEPAPAAAPEPEAPPAPPAPPPAPSPRPAPEAKTEQAAEQEEEEDDLESFQAWLRSLKR
ncbi:MAG TPA: tetratricopeptide repeat protein [Longimicrobiaceae bacterium]|nr:tetratricopeptide repeat protein [Longimicrobiaceae bacterium]